jgi:hypothetical protein
MAQGSRFESSKPDLNELAALDILFVKMICSPGHPDG